MTQDECGSSDNGCLYWRAAHHSTAIHEAACHNNVASRAQFLDHAIQPRRVVVVIGWQHEHCRRGGCCKSGDHGVEDSLPSILDKVEFESIWSICINNWQRVVLVSVVTNQHPKWCLHMAAQ